MSDIEKKKGRKKKGIQTLAKKKKPHVTEPTVFEILYTLAPKICNRRQGGVVIANFFLTASFYYHLSC